MKVWLDDYRPAPEGWVWATTADEAIAVLATGQVTECSLDHDLADEHYAHPEENIPGALDERTGYTVVCWLEQKVLEDPHFVMPMVSVHSRNPVGRAHMLAGLESIERMISRRVRV